MAVNSWNKRMGRKWDAMWPHNWCFWEFTGCSERYVVSLEVASEVPARWISSSQALSSQHMPSFASVTKRSICCTHNAGSILWALKYFYCEGMDTCRVWWCLVLKRFCCIASRLKCPQGWEAHCPFLRLNSFVVMFFLGGCICVCEGSVHSSWALGIECFYLYFQFFVTNSNKHTNQKNTF